MVKLLKHILIFFSVIVVVAATGGIGIFQYNCIYNEVNKTSMFTESIDCHFEDPVHCCAQEQKEHSDDLSKSDRVEQQNDHHCQPDHDCCSTLYSYLKTDEVNLVKKFNRTFKFYTAYRVTILNNEIDHEYGIISIQLIVDRLPPPKYGIELLFELHQLKSYFLLS